MTHGRKTTRLLFLALLFVLLLIASDTLRFPWASRSSTLPFGGSFIQRIVAVSQSSSEALLAHASGLVEDDGAEDFEVDDLVLAEVLMPRPERNFSAFAHLPPHNQNESSSFAFATLLCTRNAGRHDPYFAATQSLVYRHLWSKYASKYPFIVFVCPFTPMDQRQILRGQGADIIELPLIADIVSLDDLVVPRWADQFTKLNMWSQIQYKKIVFMDSDVFPVKNIDHFFEIAEDRECDMRALRKEISPFVKSVPTTKVLEDMCSYTFAAVDWYGLKEINGGMFIFTPNLCMHERLVSLARTRKEDFDLARMEQSLLTMAFAEKGAFPTQWLDLSMNPHGAWLEDPANFDKFVVIHQKLWAPIIVGHNPALKYMWDLDWMTLCRYYDSHFFEEARELGRTKSQLEIYSEGITKMKESEARKEKKGRRRKKKQ